MQAQSTFPDYTGEIIEGGKLTLNAIIGRGTSGFVYAAVDKRGRNFAVKWLGMSERLRNNITPKIQRMVDMKIDNEIDCHARVSKHPNVLTLHRSFTDAERHCTWMVLDMQDGDLADFLNEGNTLWQRNELTRNALTQIIDAVIYCHSRGVYHRDICPENILCSRDGTRFYLADFGCASMFLTASDWTVGALSYRAPEIATCPPLVNFDCEKADIFSLGVVLFNVMAVSSPWPVEEPSSSCITRNDVPDFSVHFPLSDAAHDIVLTVIRFKPSRRHGLLAIRGAVRTAKAFYRTPEEIAVASKYMRTRARLADAAAASAPAHESALQKLVLRRLTRAAKTLARGTSRFTNLSRSSSRTSSSSLPSSLSSNKKSVSSGSGSMWTAVDSF